MMRGYATDDGRLRLIEPTTEDLRTAVWVDLADPSPEEEAAVEAALDTSIPDRAEMEEIEISSRLYQEQGSAFMTAILPAQSESNDLQMSPVTFVLSGDRLITVRYHEPRVFEQFPRRAAKTPLGCVDGEATFIALLEAIVDRLADVLERTGQDIDAVSRGVFQHKAGPAAQERNFQDVLTEIGRLGDFTSNIRHSLMTLDRLLVFFGPVTTQRKSTDEIRTRLETLSRDTRSLTDHANFLAQKITFMLDATLGMINIEQNAIIKIFSVAAVAFLPPTLIASIYGMNFRFMPELHWPFGYPLALGLMVLSAVLPYWYFRRRGWL